MSTLLVAMALAAPGPLGAGARPVSLPPARVQAAAAPLSPPAALAALALDQAGYRSAEELIERNARPDRLLGEGHYNRVYALRDAAGERELPYALREPKASPAGGPIELDEDPFPGRALGQRVARLGDYELLTRVPGFQGGVPFHLYHTPGPEGDARYREHLERVAAMPQSAYDELARTLIELTRGGYEFDYNQARNVVIDPVEMRLHPVDLHRRPGSRHTLASMVAPLIDSNYAYRMRGPDDEALVRLRGAILDKSLAAARRTGLPLPPADDSPVPYVQHARIEFAFSASGREGRWRETREGLLAEGDRR